MNIERLPGALLALLLTITLTACDSPGENPSPEPEADEASPTQAASTPPTRETAPAPGGDQWMWPSEGDLLSAFSPAHAEGIDISAPLDSEVGAAKAGQVTYAGGDPCCGKGLHVIIEHADGYKTLYGHLSEISLQEGASVNAGDVVGTVGMTGETEEPHLHFELRRNGIFQDPLSFLP